MFKSIVDASAVRSLSMPLIERRIVNGGLSTM